MLDTGLADNHGAAFCPQILPWSHHSALATAANVYGQRCDGAGDFQRRHSAEDSCQNNETDLIAWQALRL